MNKMSLRGSKKSQQNYDFTQAANDTRPMHVLVHEFIQNVIFASFPQDNDLQIERLDLAVRLYQSIGFKRKAAFYKRFAALKYVAVHLKSPDWQECYNSLLESLDGYGLTLDPIEYEKRLQSQSGSFWPGIHIQLLEELITCSKKMQADTLAIRHMSFILHALESYLSSQRKKDLAERLELFSARCGEDSPVQLTLPSGSVISNVNLTKFPLCLHFEPLSLPMPLRPVPITMRRRGSRASTSPNTTDENPFIFTPFSNKYNQSQLPKRTLSNSVIADFRWVQDEPCSTMMKFKNTLPFELNVTGIKLLTDGVPFESTPKSLRLDPENENNMNSVTVHLTGTPKVVESSLDVSPSKTDHAIGSSQKKPLNPVIDTKLIISGYSTHVLGVKSDCKIDMLPKLADNSKFPHQYIIEVTPPLPRLEFINVSLQDNEDESEPHIEFIPMDQVNKDYVVLIYNIKVKRGNKRNLKVKFKNADDSSIDIDYINLILVGTKINFTSPRSIVQQQDNSGDISIQLTDVGNDGVNLISWNNNSIDNSLPIRIGQESEIELMIAAISVPLKENLSNNTEPPQSLSSHRSNITATLTFEYSGGRALEADFCRKSAIKFNVELLDD